MECARNTFSGVHVWKASAVGLFCRHCQSLKSAVDGETAAYNAAPEDWKERAQQALADLIATKRPFTSEDVTAAAGLPSGRVETNRNNAVGALIAQAHREGLTYSAGHQPSRNPRSNGAMLTVWRGK